MAKIFDAIKLVVDKGDYTPGKYILTGSSQFRLKQNITDSVQGSVFYLGDVSCEINGIRYVAWNEWGI